MSRPAHVGRPRTQPQRRCPPPSPTSLRQELRVGCLNVDGLTLQSLQHIVNLINSHSLDVLALTETKLTVSASAEMSRSVSLATGGRYAFFCHSRDTATFRGAHAERNGGVALIVRAGLAVSRWARSGAAATAGHNAGEDTLILAVRRSKSGPIAVLITALYLAPSLPPGEVRARLHALVTDLARAPTHARVIIATDCNVRLGRALPDYSSTDTGASDNDRTSHMLRFLDALQLVPIHGSDVASLEPVPAAATNAPRSGGTSVVDYIFTRGADLDALTARYQTAAGSHFPTLGTTHALLVASLSLPIMSSVLQRPVRRSTRLTRCPTTATPVVREALAEDKSRTLGRVAAQVVAALNAGLSTLRAATAAPQSPSATGIAHAKQALATLIDHRFTVAMRECVLRHLEAIPNAHPAVTRLRAPQGPKEGIAADVWRAASAAMARVADDGLKRDTSAEQHVPAPSSPARQQLQVDSPPLQQRPQPLLPEPTSLSLPLPPRLPQPPLPQERPPPQSQSQQDLRATAVAPQPPGSLSLRELAHRHTDATIATVAARRAVQSARTSGDRARVDAALRSLTTARKAEQRARRKHYRARKRVGANTVLQVARSHPRTFWRRIKDALEGVHADGTFGPESTTSDQTPTHFTSPTGTQVPALHAFATDARRLYAAPTGPPPAGIARLSVASQTGTNGPPARPPVDVTSAITPAEVARALFSATACGPLSGVYASSLKRGKSPGLGGLTMEMLAELGTVEGAALEERRNATTTAIAHVLTAYLAIGAQPAAWGLAAVHPIAKDGVAPTEPAAFRNITVQTLACKLFNGILNGRLVEWVEEHHVLSHAQFGFRHGRCTEDAILTVTGALNVQTRGRRLPAYAAFVDLRKAYDLVIRDALYAKLAALGVGENFINVLRSGHSGSRARVWLHGELSAEFPMERGVPQGDPMSPTLFAIFINDLLRELEASPTAAGLVMGPSTSRGTKIVCVAYADDLVLLAATPESLQAALDIVGRWAADWGMVVNTSRGKTEVMLFPAEGGTLASVPRPAKGHWTIPSPTGGPPVPIAETESYVYLGYAMSPALDTERPLRDRMKSAHFAAHRLRTLPLRRLRLSPMQLTELYNSLVLPHMLYGAAIYAPAPSTSAFASATPHAYIRNPADRKKTCPIAAAVALHARMAEFALGRTVGDQMGRLRMSRALAFYEAGWLPLQTHWDRARLRQLGNVLVSPPEHPMRAVAASLAAHASNAAVSPACVAWNWIAQTWRLIASIDEQPRAPPSRPKLLPLIDVKTLRFRDGAHGWRSRTREALYGPAGRDAVAWRERVLASPSGPAPFTTTHRASAPPSVPGPRSIGAHASMAWIITATRAATTIGLGSRFIPEYRRFMSDSLAVEARFRLRTASHVFWDVNDRTDIFVVPGLLWQVPLCTSCTDLSDARVHVLTDDSPGVTVLDLWHRICECPKLEHMRLAALSTAAARSADLAPVFGEIANAPLADPQRQCFLFLATLGAALYDGDGSGCGIPQRWAACLAMPRPAAGVPKHARSMSAAVAITLPAFGAFARFLARPIEL